jgi:hypothetical protein
LIAHRTLPNQPEPQITTHFTGRVRLAKNAPSPITTAAMGTPTGAVIEAAEIYRLYFHGPAYQVIERAWWDGYRIIGMLSNHLPANHQPADLPTLIAPRLIELCFQTAGLWEMGVQGRMGLPQHVDEVRMLRSTDKAESRLYAVVTPHPSRGAFDADVVDTAGNLYIRLLGYRTVALPNAVDAGRLKGLQSAMTLEPIMA